MHPFQEFLNLKEIASIIENDKLKNSRRLHSTVEYCIQRDIVHINKAPFLFCVCALTTIQFQQPNKRLIILGEEEELSVHKFSHGFTGENMFREKYSRQRTPGLVTDQRIHGRKCRKKQKPKVQTSPHYQFLRTYLPIVELYSVDYRKEGETDVDG
ncbi:hypothetical protein AVEN_259443-1 [Araneus ventricosus]|uniref:Uncharacterized protein n=1 Tax=Araneus ventricosus TaxID=182803 RepID=A0A4Y2R9N3_ARAVE|nr:hypothetical protein AVEN_259443-1 [Araneus ventricosus]